MYIFTCSRHILTNLLYWIKLTDAHLQQGYFGTLYTISPRNRKNTCQMRYVHVSLRPWPLTLEVTALVADAGLCAPSAVPSLKFIGLPVRDILGIYCVSINRPGDLDLWPFGLYLGSRVTCRMYFYLPILGFVGLSFHELGWGTRQTDRQTDGQTALIL